MTTKELITALGLRHLRAQDVKQIEQAMNADDLEVMLAAVDQIVVRRLAKALKDRRGHDTDRRP